MSKKAVAKPGRGRPSNVKKIILTNSVQFPNRTDKEMVTFLLEKTAIRTFMKEADDNIIKRNLYVSVRNTRAESLKNGKKVEFKGRKVNGVLKKSWIHTPKAKVVPAQA